MDFEGRCKDAFGNLILSYSTEEDRASIEKGYSFLGVGLDSKGSEVHIFQKFPISTYAN